MKKLAAIGVSLLLALALAACAQPGSPGAGSAPESNAGGESNAAPESNAPGEPSDQTMVGGIIMDAGADSLTLAAPDGTSYVFSTGDADKTAAGELKPGGAVWVDYTGELPADGGISKADRLVQAEPQSVTGTVNEGTAMSTLVLDTDDGQMEFSFGGAAADGVAIGKRVTVTYAQNPDAPGPYQIVTLSIQAAD